MIRPLHRLIFQVMLALVVTLSVWYGQATFDLAGDYRFRADFFLTQGRTALARDYYQQAVLYAPNNAALHFQLALVYLERGDYDNARETLIRAEQTGYTNQFELHYQMGRAAYYLSDYAAAEHHFQSALTQIDMLAANYSLATHANLLALRGWGAIHLGGCIDAEADFAEALLLTNEANLAHAGQRYCQSMPR